MSLRQLLRKPLPSSSFFHPHPPPSFRPHLLRAPPRRLTSTSSSESRTRSRVDRVLNRLPKFLRPYTDGLRNAPVSHIVSFLILHEITAIIPLVGLAGLFHYTQWLPVGFVEGKWVTEGTERFGRYFGRKGWFGFSRDGASPAPSSDSEAGRVGDTIGDGDVLGEAEDGAGKKTREGLVEETEMRWHVGEAGGRILVEVATAYAITKVLLPARILVSVWGTPWFARVVLGLVKGVFGRKGP